MRIRTYFLNSFLVHTIFLIYILSLPLHKATFQLVSYGTYVVYLKGEREINRRIPSPAYVERKTVSKTNETDLKKDITDLKAEEEAISGKSEVKQKQPTENPVKVAELKETPDFKDTTKEEQAPVVDNEEQEKAKKTEDLPEKVAPATEVKKSTESVKIEEPANNAVENKNSGIQEVQKTQNEQKPQTSVENVLKEDLNAKGHNSGLLKHALETKRAEREIGIKAPSTKESGPLRIEGKTEINKVASLKAETGRGVKKQAEKVISGLEVQGLASTQVKTPSQEGDQGEGKQKQITTARQEHEEKAGAGEKTAGMGIPVSEALIPVDLKIEVFLRKPSASHSEPGAQEVSASLTTKHKNISKATEITKISLEESNDGIKVQIRCNGLINPKVFPYLNRVVIDIPDVVTKAKLPTNLPTLLKAIRSGKHKDKSRLVLDLNEKKPFDVSPSEDSVIITLRKSENKSESPPVEQMTPKKIEAIEPKENVISNISMHLLKNPHPKSEKREKQMEMTLLEGKREPQSENKSSIRKSFSVLRTDEGAYTFVLKNQENDAYEADLVFLIFSGKKGERTRKFAAIKLSPHTTRQFKFILPEAIFWDDEDYFSGKIENSDTMTKFNQKTGIVWKETKDE